MLHPTDDPVAVYTATGGRVHLSYVSSEWTACGQQAGSRVRSAEDMEVDCGACKRVRPDEVGRLNAHLAAGGGS